MRSTGTLLTSALAATLGLMALPTGSAQADSTIPISQLTGFHQMVVDSADGYILLSEGTGSSNLITSPLGGSAIIVTNLAGEYITTLDAGDGVEGIALDGGTLYAALAAKGAVAAIDIATISKASPTQTLYPLGTGDVPYSVAVQSGKVWVSYVPGPGGRAGNSAIGDINLAAASPASAFEPDTAAPANWYSPPDLAADPDNNGVLVAVLPQISLATAATFSTTTDPATPLAAQAPLGGTYTPLTCEFENQLAAIPGGSQFITACESPHSQQVFSTTNLMTPVRSYVTGNAPTAVAVSTNGTVAAGITNSAYPTNSSPPSVYVYRPDDTLLNIIRFGNSQAIADGGLAWSADGSQLFAVLEYFDVNTGTFTFSLQVIDQPTLTRSILSLSGPSTADITKSVALTGNLALSTGVAPPAGTPITVTRSLAGSTATKNFTVATAANGGFTVQDTPPTLGKYTYTVSYSGSTTIAPATASHTVSVTRIPTSLRVTTGSTTFTYEATIHVTAHLGTTYTNRTVSIYAQRFGSRSRALVKTGRVNSGGNLTVSYAAPRSTTFSAVFSGDARYAPKTVTRAAYIRAKVSESLSGYYGSRRIGRISYLLFHRSDLLHAHAAVAPNKRGQCVEFEVQEFYQGAWNANVTTGCINLSSSSQASAVFGLAQADIGFPYRIRTDYIRSSKDTSNLSNDSAWQYLMVET